MGDLTLDDNQDSSFIELDGGIRVATGLQTPSSRPLTFSPFLTSSRKLTKQQIQEWIGDPRRTSCRKFFTASEWIFSQDTIGSCNAAAAVVALEKTRETLGRDNVKLSPEFLYGQINGGRDRGSMLDDGMKAIMEIGTCRREMVPHQEYRSSRMRPECLMDASRFRGFECYRIDNELGIATAAASNYMIIVALHAGNRFMRLDRNGVAGSESGSGNHAVHIDDVRIRDGQLEFDMVNSWGLRYGEEGRAWTTWAAHYARTVRHHAFYAIRGATRDPQSSPVVN